MNPGRNTRSIVIFMGTTFLSVIIMSLITITFTSPGLAPSFNSLRHYHGMVGGISFNYQHGETLHINIMGDYIGHGYFHSEPNYQIIKDEVKIGDIIDVWTVGLRDYPDQDRIWQISLNGNVISSYED